MNDAVKEALAAWAELNVHQRCTFVVSLCEDGGADLPGALFMACHDDKTSAEMFDKLTGVIDTAIQIKLKERGSPPPDTIL